MKNTFGDYEKNRKPMVKVTPTEEEVKQGDQNLSPVVPPVASKPKYSDKVMPDNGVTNSSSAKLQKATKLPGRVGKSSAHKKLS